MKDIDFDELDRAVNSLMSGVPKAEPAKEDDVKTLALPASSPGADDKADSEPAHAASSSSEVAPSHDPEVSHDAERSMSTVSVTPAAVVPPAARRGRFMDMVRPAAETQKSVPSRPLSRHSGSIEPTKGFTSQSAPPVEGITSPPHQPAAQPDVSSSGDWPDPLAAVDFDKTTEAVGNKAPLTTPFLPDAKVEKRPLGRVADGDSAPEPDHAPVLGALAVSGNGTTGNPAETTGDTAVPQQPLPAELGQDVMAIEADTSSVSPEQPESTMEINAAPSRPVAPSPTSATPRPVATSIPQQYKVQPKVADPSPGAIYDTATYHQPLSHPAKKQPGWLWVIAIILILLLGAASGAAVYFYGLV